ncbi:hypothetical protein BDF19DRAFT_280112 [Syncephalis fuscata]|nr:hypothetical protein BDF19DRAFT_280112 [Syncephalis fuscata]
MLETAEREWWSRLENPGEWIYALLNYYYLLLILLDGRLPAYDLLAQHVTAMITIHENQRAATMFSRLLSMQPPKYSSNALTRADPAPWTRPPNHEPCTLDDVQLPVDPRYQHLRSPREDQRAWFWLTDWQPDVHHPRTDDEGFEYASSFMSPAHEWRPTPPQNTPGVRRRRYVRVMKRVVEIDGMDAASIAANNMATDSQIATSDDPRRRSGSFAAIQPDYIQEARTALEEAVAEAEDSLRLAAQYEYSAIDLLDKARSKYRYFI